MDPKYKELIPLIVISFILGAAVGYVAHKPEAKIEYINKTEIVTVTVTVTPTPTPALTPTPTLTPAPTPAIADFTVKIYEPSRDVPTKTIEFINDRASPSDVFIKPGDTVLIKITDYTLTSRLTFILNETYSRDLGASGAVVVTFNNKGKYSFKGIFPSGDPNILSQTYAEGTITVS